MCALLANSPAQSATADEILELAREVCLAHGSSLMSVEAIARERRWRDLALPELEAARNANQIGYMTGWAIRDGDDPITLTIALPPWTLTNAMRSRRDAGSPILPPPEPSLRMFGGNVPDFPRRSADQYCDIRFVVNEVEGEAIAAGARQLPFLNETFGNPALGLDNEPVDGLPQSDGRRWWRWSRFHDQIWQRIRFELKPQAGPRSSFQIDQNWTD